MARAAADPQIRIEPAWKVSLVYGMPCAIYHILPAAYYLAARLFIWRRANLMSIPRQFAAR
jgi:hypothetical protein